MIDFKNLLDNKDKSYQSWELNEHEFWMRWNALVKRTIFTYAPIIGAAVLYGLVWIVFFVLGNPIAFFGIYLLLFAAIGGLGQWFWFETYAEKLKEIIEDTHKELKDDKYLSGARIVDSKVFNSEIEKKMEDEYNISKNERDKRVFTFPLQELYNKEDWHFEESPIDLKIPHFALSTGLAILGRPGSGKSVMINQLISQIPNSEKVVIGDVKGEFLQKHFNPETDIIVCPSDLRSVRFDLYELVNSNVDTAAIAEILVAEDKSTQDPHWTSSARAVMEGILLYASRRKMSNREIYRLMSDPEALFKIIDDEEVKPLVAHFLRKDEGATSKESASIISTLVRKAKALQYLAYLDDLKDNPKINLSKWLNDGRGGKMFLLATENLNKVFGPLFGVIISYLISQILDGNDNRTIDYYFVLDELPQLGKALGENLEKAAAVGRSKGIKTVVAMQSNSQLQKVFGKEAAESLLDTINSICVFGNNFGAQFVEKYLGKTTLERKNESYSFSIEPMGDRIQKQKQRVTEAVVKESDIQRLETFEFLLKLVTNPDLLKSRFKPVFYKTNTEKYIENPAMKIEKLQKERWEMVQMIKNRYVDIKAARDKKALDMEAIDVFF